MAGLKIGTIRLKHGIVLGPMAGVTDLPYRVLCKEMGCELLYTEMVSAKAIYYKSYFLKCHSSTFLPLHVVLEVKSE